jgi:hypothetical protein
MKSALVTRLRRLENVQAIQCPHPVELQIGYLKKLPPEYTGERHVVIVSRDVDGRYRWEERRGPEPVHADQGDARSIVRVNLVSPGAATDIYC